MRPLKPIPPAANAGFTLLEMIVIIIIVAILAAIATPGWLALMNRQRVGAVQSDLVQVLRQAQQEAIQQRQTVSVSIFTPDELPAGQENLPAVGLQDDPATAAYDGRPLQTLGPGDLRPDMVEMDVVHIDPSNGSVTNLPEAGDPFATVSFDYQGMVREQELPIVINITPVNGDIQECVIVASILGNLKTAEDAECDNPPL